MFQDAKEPIAVVGEIDPDFQMRIERENCHPIVRRQSVEKPLSLDEHSHETDDPRRLEIFLKQENNQAPRRIVFTRLKYRSGLSAHGDVIRDRPSDPRDRLHGSRFTANLHFEIIGAQSKHGLAGMVDDTNIY